MSTNGVLQRVTALKPRRLIEQEPTVHGVPLRRAQTISNETHIEDIMCRILEQCQSPRKCL